MSLLREEHAYFFKLAWSIYFSLRWYNCLLLGPLFCFTFIPILEKQMVFRKNLVTVSESLEVVIDDRRGLILNIQILIAARLIFSAVISMLNPFETVTFVSLLVFALLIFDLLSLCWVFFVHYVEINSF